MYYIVIRNELNPQTITESVRSNIKAITILDDQAYPFSSEAGFTVREGSRNAKLWKVNMVRF